MTKSEKEEIESSILLLKEYRKRITNEVINLGNKLRMPQEKINLTLRDHKELKEIEELIKRLSEEN